MMMVVMMRSKKRDLPGQMLFPFMANGQKEVIAAPGAVMTNTKNSGAKRFFLFGG